MPQFPVWCRPSSLEKFIPIESASESTCGGKSTPKHRTSAGTQGHLVDFPNLLPVVRLTWVGSFGSFYASGPQHNYFCSREEKIISGYRLRRGASTSCSSPHVAGPHRRVLAWMRSRGDLHLEKTTFSKSDQRWSVQAPKQICDLLLRVSLAHAACTRPTHNLEIVMATRLPWGLCYTSRNTIVSSLAGSTLHFVFGKPIKVSWEENKQQILVSQPSHIGWCSCHICDLDSGSDFYCTSWEFTGSHHSPKFKNNTSLALSQVKSILQSNSLVMYTLCKRTSWKNN